MSSRYISQGVKEGINLLRGQSTQGQTDERITPCSVDLYSRPIAGQPIAEHWLLHFKWHHYQATYEANDVNGILEPIGYPGPPEPSRHGNYKVKRLKTNLRVYPDAVNEMAKKNKFNRRRYNVVTANCQHWARELGRLLGIQLPDDQVVQGVDIAATATAIVGAIVGGVALIATGLSRGNKH